MTSRSTLATATAAALLAVPLAAQTALPGFVASPRYTVQGVQHGIDALACSSAGQLFVAHRSGLWEVDAQGQRTLLHSLPSGHWFGPLLMTPDDAVLLACDFTAQQLLGYAPGNGQTTALGPIPANTFDLAWLPGTGLLASANPNWPNPGAQPGIYLLDGTASGRELVRLSGASGPCSVDPAGNLWVATASATYPPPPGSSRLLRFSAQQVARALAGNLLTEADGTRVGAVDSAYDLALDDRGHAYLSNALAGQVHRIALATGVGTTCVDTAGAGTTQLVFLAGHRGATYMPFQPEHGGALVVAIADWVASRSEVVHVVPARPSLEVSPSDPVPRGAASILARGVAPLAPCVLFLSPLPSLPEWALLTVAGAPVWFGLDTRGGGWSWSTTADAAGIARWPFHHGGPGLQLALQALTLSAEAVGTSPPRAITLQ